MIRRRLSAARRRLAPERGFTMIVTIGILFITGLLLVAAFTIAQGEVEASRNDVQDKQAYFAALSGVQEYEYQLQANPNYWQKCTGPSGTVPGESKEKYEVSVMPSTTAEEEKKTCSASAPFATAIESKGSLVNTFRIKSVGTAGKETRTLIATFKVKGFLDYIYFTNYETLDPELYAAGSECKGQYRSEWIGKSYASKCVTIIFAGGDHIEGPMHTNDASRVEGAAFGRKEHSPPDEVEINGGTYPEDENEKCTGSAKFYTETGCYTTKGETLQIPESDTSLESYVESANKWTGETIITLNGTTYNVKRWEKGVPEEKKGLAWPKNGLIFVTNNGTCSSPYEPHGADTGEEITNRENCGDVYVQGSYSESVTVAAEDNLVVTGNIYPTSVAGKLGSEPTGTPVAGLIASNFVRVYHPVFTTYSSASCKSGDKSLGGGKCEYKNSEGGCDAENIEKASEDPNGWGSLHELYVYGAILSTAHSFIVDNWTCGEPLGKLHEYGAIAQNYRGTVGTTGGEGYLKDYKYDGRLATDEPPYFLAPLKAGWKIIRETAPKAG